MKIDILINNQSLDLVSGFEIPIEENGVLTSLNTIPGSYTLPIKIPITDNNSRLLSFVDKFETSNRLRQFDCQILLNSALFVDSILSVLRVSDKEITASISLDSFPVLILNKSIKNDVDYGPDLVIGNDTDEIAQNAWAINELKRDETNIRFPKWNAPNFYGAENNDYKGVVNWNSNLLDKMLKNLPLFGNEFNLVPFLYLEFILQKIGESFGVKISGDLIDDPELKELLVFNNYALDKLEGDAPEEIEYTVTDGLIFYDVSNFNLKFTKEITDPNDDWQNSNVYVIPAAGKYKISMSYTLIVDEDQGYIDYDFLVKKGANQVLFQESVAVEYGLNIIVLDFEQEYFFNNNDVGNYISFRLENVRRRYYLQGHGWQTTYNQSLIGTQSEANYSLAITKDESFLNIYDGVVGYKNHVPNLSMSNFFIALRGLGMYVKYNSINKEIQFNSYSRLFENLPLDVTADIIGSINKHQPIKAINNTVYDGFLLAYNLNSDDQQIQAEYPELNDLSQVIVGNGSEEVSFLFTPMLMGLDDHGFLVPQYNGGGNSILGGFANPDFPLKFTLWKGNVFISPVFNELGQQITDQDYSFASSYALDSEQNPTNDLDLRITKNDQSFFSKHWSRFLHLIQSSESVEIIIRTTQKQLENIPDDRELIIKNQKYILSKKNYNISTDKKSVVARLSLLKINS